MAKKMKIDFSDVPEDIRQRGRHIPEGDYALKIVKYEKRWKDDDKSNTPYLSWTIQVADGKYKGAPLYYRTSLKPEALFNLRNLIHAATGKNVAGKSVSFDPEKLYGKKIAGTVEDDEYEGKIRSDLVDVRPLSELEKDDEDDDDTEEEEVEEEEEEEEDDDLEEVDLDDDL